MKASDTRYCVSLHNLFYILCHLREFDRIDDVNEEDGYMKTEVKYQDVTLEEINVIKRDGRSVKFNSEKIVDALTKAAKKVELTDKSVLSELTDRVVSEIFSRVSENGKIYEIQSIVDQELLESGETALAEEYISYRANRDLARTKATDINFTIEKIG